MSIFEMSFYGAVMIAVISLLRAAAKNKLPKKTFIILWGIALLRLLVPYRLPSALSVYSFFDSFFKTEAGSKPDYYFEQPAGFVYTDGRSYASDIGSYALPELQEDKPDPESEADIGAVLRIVWLAGTAVCGAVFVFMYFRCELEFKTSLPADNGFIRNWLSDHKIKRTVTIRQSDKITAPLTYGVFRPVILITKNAEKEENRKALEYALLHEYIHIRRFDSLLKLICAAAVCLHWFDPAVWLMYALLNRDIELACDEKAVKILGLDSKAEYAYMLIGAEEKKAGLTPLYSGFGKSPIKERIVAVMKIKKLSLIAVIAAVILTVSVTAIFATSAVSDPYRQGEESTMRPAAVNNEEAVYDTEKMSGSAADMIFTEADLDMIKALQFDNYEDMTVSEYREKVHKITDTEEYGSLFERFSRYGSDFDLDRNETADFVLNTLFPLIGENWQRYDLYGGFSFVTGLGSGDILTVFEIDHHTEFLIRGPEILTVGEYAGARKNMINALEGFPGGLTEEQLIDRISAEKLLDEFTADISERYSSESLAITVSASLHRSENEYLRHEYDVRNPNEETRTEETELRSVPNADRNDYDSLFALKTPDYREMSLKDFNMSVLEWASDDHERMERIDADIKYNDFAAELSDDELSFVLLTFCLSGRENSRFVQSSYTGRPEEDPVWSMQLTPKTESKNGLAAWCDLYCEFSYHISDKETVTVGLRDKSIGGMIEEINEFWDNADIDEILKMTESDIVNRLNETAAKRSGGGVTIFVNADRVSFECMDERNYDTERAVFQNNADPGDYAVYAPFGLTVGENGKLYYSGSLVRCFDDSVPKGFFSVKAIGYYEPGGVLDIRAVRENSELKGLEILSEEEFGGRVINGSPSEISAGAAGDENETDTSIFDIYIEYGLEYDISQNALFYGGKRIRLFWDSPFVKAAPSASESPFIYTVSNWDEKGEIDLYVDRDYTEKDGRGYGRVTGLHVADEGEFLENSRLF